MIIAHVTADLAFDTLCQWREAGEFEAENFKIRHSGIKLEIETQTESESRAKLFGVHSASSDMERLVVNGIQIACFKQRMFTCEVAEDNYDLILILYKLNLMGVAILSDEEGNDWKLNFHNLPDDFKSIAIKMGLFKEHAILLALSSTSKQATLF